MPGLLGIVRKQGRCPIDDVLFQRMVTRVCHRPWYKVDTYHTADLAIARVHLNIINTETQPYVGGGGRVRVFLQGEIYNDEASIDKQLEFIARTYEQFGCNFVTRLIGSFVLALLDDAARTIIIATDRIGSKPLFYYEDDTHLYFAPELKALTLIPSLSKRLNESAVASFLACGHYLEGEALLQSVQLLNNATMLMMSAGGTTTRRYWEYRFNETATDRGERYYRGALRELIRHAVRRRIRSEHSYGILLSGGYDSRGILGCYLDEQSAKPLTISWGSAEDVPGSDCAVAKRLATELGLRHVFFPLRTTSMAEHVREFIWLHDGLTDACDNYPESLKIFSEIRESLGVQVILRGDESFGFSRPACDERTVFEKFGMCPVDRSRIYRNILRSSWLATFSNSMRETLAQIGAQRNTKDIYLSQNYLYLSQRIKNYINPLNYVKSLEVEVRTPYLDDDILNFMRELPSYYHFGKKFYRNLTRQMFPHLFAEMATCSNLPKLDTVLRNSAFKKLLFETNVSDTSPLMGYFDVGKTKQLHEKYFNEAYHNDDDWCFVEAVSKALAKWPSIHRLGYRLYLPLQNKLQHDITSEARILIRMLTINLYLERVFQRP